MEPVAPEKMGSIRTLSDIAGLMGESSPASVPVASAASPSSSPAPVAPGPVSSGYDHSGILLSVVSDKTGYPREMLDLDMSLEGDLGIDSIKRVEIFSALRDQLPHMEPVAPEKMGSIGTLSDIVDYMSGGSLVPADETTAPAGEIPALSKSPAPESVAVTDASLTAQDSAVDVNRELQRMVLKTRELHECQRMIEITIKPGCTIWITDEDTGLSSAVEGQFQSMGYDARVVPLPLMEGMEIPRKLGGLIVLAPSGETPSDFMKDAFSLIQKVGPALVSSAEDEGAFLVTVSRIDGQFGLGDELDEARPVTGGLAGLLKTTAREWPRVYCKAIDLGPGFDGVKESSSQLADEIFIHGPVEVGITPSARVGLEMIPEPLKADGRDFPLNDGDLIVVTGGARGVTAACALRLARGNGSVRPSLLLLGRSPEPRREPSWLAQLKDEAEIKRELMTRTKGKPDPRKIRAQYQRLMANREILNNLEEIEKTGVRVLYRSVDVRDREALKAVLDEARSEIGPVRGLVHGAGVIADKLILDKKPEEFDRVYSTKALGALNLLELLENEDLQLMAFFSSSTGRVGRTGQGDYAIANEVLNKLAQVQARLRPSARVVSINWGPWDGGMVTDSLKKIFQSEGVGVIPMDAGAELLFLEFCFGPGGPVEVIVQGQPPGKDEPGGDDSSKAYADMPSLTPAIEKEISIEQFPVLAHHVLDGRGVLPMALMVELLAHGAMHTNPGLQFGGFDNLKVLKGLLIGSGQKRTYQVMAGRAMREGDRYTVPVELQSTSDPGGMDLNVRGEIFLTSSPAQKEEPRLALPEMMPYIHVDFYRDFLFHGPYLQGIESVTGVSPGGISGIAGPGPRPDQWMKSPWRNSWITEPLILDCAFQLMILWSFEQLGSGSLPTGVGSYRQFCRFPGKPVTVDIQVKDYNSSRALSDIEFKTPQGILIARMENYQCVIDPSLKKAFNGNSLEQEIMS